MVNMSCSSRRAAEHLSRPIQPRGVRDGDHAGGVVGIIFDKHVQQELIEAGVLPGNLVDHSQLEGLEEVALGVICNMVGALEFQTMRH